MKNLFRIAFILPGEGTSGGVRVTVAMANELIGRGHEVRILCRSGGHPIRKWWNQGIRGLFRNRAQTNWIRGFQGKLEYYRDIRDKSFDTEEIAIAVGSLVLDDLELVRDSVRRLRYCHGLGDYTEKEMRRVWGGIIPIIAVSSKLVPRLVEFGIKTCLVSSPMASRRRTTMLIQKSRRMVSAVCTIKGLRSAQNS